MLHENPSMVDIDVNHWRNLQVLLLESAKERRRIVVIHEGGRIQKFVHSGREPIVRAGDRVDDPHAFAERVYRANADRVDFVAVFERRAFDRYFAAFQDSWRPDEDLDAFVHRTYAMMDDYPDGIVTYPGPARATLGLQWRVGAAYEAVADAVQRFVVPGSTVVLGVFEGDELWAGLVLGFDQDRRAKLVTTVDPSRLAPAMGREAIVQEVVAWVDRTYDQCSLALFAGIDETRAFLRAPDKWAALREMVAAGSVVAGPVPAELNGIVTAV